MKQITFLCVLFLSIGSLFAQESTTKLPFNQIKFSLTPAMYDNLNINPQNKDLVKSCSGFGGEIGVAYYQRFYRGFGMNIGAGFNMASFNIKYNEEFEEGSKSFHGMTYPMFSFDIPLSLQLTLPDPRVKKWLYNMELGAKLNGILQNPNDWSYTYSTLQSNGYTNDEFKFNMTTSQQYSVSIFMKIGVAKLTKKSNTLHCNVVFNYNPQTVGSGFFEGTKQINNNDFEGYAQQSLNYVGVEFIYGLTLCKKK